MCAIAGILSFDANARPQADKVRTLLRRMKHRGPDGTQVIEQPSCVLGANRLAQIDVEGGGQPMHSPDGRWTLVFNGEIHNHRELRAQLESHWHFTTRSDTEVLLAALVTWGEAALDRLNGMFAFFLWDAQSRVGLAARDRLGVKPFVWTQTASGIAFASEAKALLALVPGKACVNAAAVLEYFVAPCFSGVATPMFADMQHLLPGHSFTLSEQGMKQRAWWRYDLRQAVCEDEVWLQQRLHALLPKSVDHTLDTDTSAAVLLSGGLDSTLVAACAKQHGITCAYTIAFEGQSDFDYARALMVKSDDLPHAVTLAQVMNLRHHVVLVSRASLADDLRTLAIQNDALPAWEQELAQHHLARAVSKDFRALLVGDAADETHYGYGFMLDDESISHPQRLLSRLSQVALTPTMQSPAERLAQGYLQMITEAGHTMNSRAEKLRGITHLIVQRWLPRLLQNGDIHTMAHGVEARVPFGDKDLLSLAVQVDPELALRNGMEKHLLRLSARGLMPEAARLRRKSSLSKDDACGVVYQQEALKALNESKALLAHWLDLSSLKALCHPEHRPTEMERALLFRVICFHHWATAYQVREP